MASGTFCRKYVSDNCKIYRYCRSESSSFPNGMGNSRGYPKTSHRNQRIYFERGTVNVPILSPNHYWNHFSSKYGPLIQAIRLVKEQSEEKVELLRKDFLNAIRPYIYDNELRVGYLLTIGIKE